MSAGKFLTVTDELSRVIQEQASVLYQKLNVLDADRLGMPDNCLAYFKGSHHKRLFFSIETSAHLLYRSITRSGKTLQETIIMDYGAGVGTLYTLAKMIGCKKVIYNDHLAEWKQSAQLIARAIGVEVDEYIVGDIGDTLKILEEKNIRCTIITSRNVIEHIYRLDLFFKAIASYQPEALVYSSTTANIMNPATRAQHLAMHRKWEKVYCDMRGKMIKAQVPQLSAGEQERLAIATQGKAGEDIRQAVRNYVENRQLPDPRIHRSNTCHPDTGVWVEHLLTFEEYRSLAAPEYSVSFEPGFWDTHYSTTWKNLLGKTLNRLSSLATAPFIYVIAERIINGEYRKS